MRTVLTVVGARPQFVKAAPLSPLLRERFREVLVHTGQHYDQGLSGAQFASLAIPEPDVNLGVGSAGHAEQTARMLSGLHALIRDLGPDLVIAFGDTNSTLAASLAAAHAGVPLAHVEAGLRSFRRAMPEEVNRIAADHLADLCLCPTESAVANLAAEGIVRRARLVGDVMLDVCLQTRDGPGRGTLGRHGLEPGGFFLATVHRPRNTDRFGRLSAILRAFADLPAPVVFPVHPRTKAALENAGAELPKNVVAIDPLSYPETLELVAAARAVLTDSGGLQKEAYFLGTPCVTLRAETEWTETVASGRNVLADADPERIVAAARAASPLEGEPDLSRFGGGRASRRIVLEIERFLDAVADTFHQ